MSYTGVDKQRNMLINRRKVRPGSNSHRDLKAQPALELESLYFNASPFF
jgi:hypothetical protein